MDTDEQPAAASHDSGEADVNMQAAKGTTDSDASGVENGVPETDKPVQMETDTKVRSMVFQFRFVLVVMLDLG